MFISYAQNFEDIILWRALKHIENGRYIDIGAQDPIVDSVSRGFYEKGWRGVHVEPTETYAQELRENRPDETVIQAAIGSGAAVIEFFEIPATGLSTGDRPLAAKYEREGHSVLKTTVPLLPLSGVLDQMEDRETHWLKIDVEGMEASVIASWLPAKSRPWIVVIESTVPGEGTTPSATWDQELVALGYEFVYFDGLNRFYVSVKHPELKGSFGPGANVFDDFKLSGYSTASFSRLLEDKVAELDALRADNSGLKIDLAGLRSDNDRLSETIEDSIAEKLHFNKVADDLRSENSNLAAAVELLQSENEELRVANARLNRRLDDVLKSTSWRMTKPYRFVGRGLKWFIAGVVAWVTLKPGTRPRRVARNAVRAAIPPVVQRPKLLGAAKRLLAWFPNLENRLRRVASDDFTVMQNPQTIPLLHVDLVSESGAILLARLQFAYNRRRLQA